MNRRGYQPGCRHITLFAALLVVGATAVISPPALAGESATDTLHRIETEIGNVENVLNLLKKEFALSANVGSGYNLEKRFVDAQVFYDLESYENASVLFFDLVENPSFKSNRKYLDATFYLAMSLWHADNYSAARPYFEEVGRSRSPHRSASLIQLIEMALDESKTANLKNLITWVRRSGADRDANVRYVLGKALYRIGQHDEALKELGRISGGEGAYGAAQHYMGVIYTARKDYRTAVTHFELASHHRATTRDGKPDKKWDRVRGQAVLALGRLYSSMGEPERAVAAYQEVDRHSVDFEVALYEMAWVYIGSDNISQALQTLEILLLIVKDKRLAAESNVLRARLMVEEQRHEEAVFSYKDVISEYGPIQRELERLARSNEKLGKYFDWLLHRQNTDYDINRPLSERAAAFIEADSSLSGMVSVFDTIGQERRDILFSRKLVDQIRSALKGAQKMDVFPQLQDGWARLMGAENQLIFNTASLLEAENQLLMEVLSGKDLARAEGLAATRHSLERRFRKEVPNSVAEYKEREHFANNEFEDVEREAFVVRQLMDRAREQLQAFEQWVTENVSLFQGEEGATEVETKIRKEIEVERKRLLKLYDELVVLQEDIESAQALMGMSDVLAQAEANIKNKILAAFKEEHAAYVKLRKSLGPQEKTVASDLARLRRRVFSRMGDVASVLKIVEKQVDVQVRRLNKVLAKEQRKVRRYYNELKANEKTSRTLAGDVGFVLFRGARDAVREMVLEADVGLIDVAWQRKQTNTERLRELIGERNLRIRDLDDSLRAIMGMDAGNADAPKGMVKAPVDGKEELE